MPIITVLLYVLAIATTAARRLKPPTASVPPKMRATATKYAAIGRKSSCATCTVLMVRNSSGGVITTNTRLDRSFTPPAPIHRMRPARKPTAMRMTTGTRALRTGEFTWTVHSRAAARRSLLHAHGFGEEVIQCVRVVAQHRELAFDG